MARFMQPRLFINGLVLVSLILSTSEAAVSRPTARSRRCGLIGIVMRLCDPPLNTEETIRTTTTVPPPTSDPNDRPCPECTWEELFSDLCTCPTSGTTTTTTATPDCEPFCFTDPPRPIPAPTRPPPPPSGEIDLLSIAETCSANFITQDYKQDWEDAFINDATGEQWDIGMTNRLHIYLLAANMYETYGFRSFNTNSLHQSCLLTTRLNGWEVTNTTGYGGRSVALRLVRTSLPKVYRFFLPYGPTGFVGGTASIILSDNRSYNVFEYCFDNGLRTFAVYYKQLLTEQDRRNIKLHLRAIGFKERHMVDLDTDTQCLVGTSGDGILELRTFEDLPVPGPPSESITRFISTNSLLPVPPLFWKKK